jgi:hypothetical protein
MPGLLITCDDADEWPLTLKGVGFEHPRRLVMYGEADHDAIAFVVQAVNLIDGRQMETEPLAPAYNGHVSRLLYRVSLRSGPWLLRLESWWEGVVATRQIGVRDEEE